MFRKCSPPFSNGGLHYVIMRDRYVITVSLDGFGLWYASRRPITGPSGTLPLLVGTGPTLRDALDEVALLLEREHRAHGDAPHGS